MKQSMKKRVLTPPEERLVFSVPEAGRLLNLGRGTAYSLASQGVLPTIRLGKKLAVPKAALARLLQDTDRQTSS